VRIKHRGPLHEESSAPRRGWAGGATKQLPGSTVGSLVPAGIFTAEPLWFRALHGLSHRNTVWRSSGRSARRGVRGRPDACRALVACPRPRSASTRPVSSVRVQCPRPVSASAMSTRPVSSVQCPVWASVVRCPVWASGVRVRYVRSSVFLERIGTAGSHTASLGEGRGSTWSPPCPRTARASTRARAGRSGRRRPCWQWRRRPDRAIVLGGAQAAGQVRPPGQPGTSRLSARIARREGSGVCGDVRSLRHGCARVATGRLAGRADHDLAGPER
jgi:hypothetical protein